MSSGLPGVHSSRSGPLTGRTEHHGPGVASHDLFGSIDAGPDAARYVRRYARRVIEIMRFRLAEGTSDDDFARADKSLQEDFAYQQPGLLRRTTARADDGTWVVIDLWASAADADASGKRWQADPVAQEFMRHVDRDSVTTEHYSELD